MKVFLDTNVLVAAVVQKHPDQSRAFRVLDRVQSGQDEGFVSAHTLVEMYAILTRLPMPFRHRPDQALLSIEENVEKHFKSTYLNGAEYMTLIRESALVGVQGGTIYDAVLLRCAGKAKVSRIYTFNLNHFQAIAAADMSPLLSVP